MPRRRFHRVAVIALPQKRDHSAARVACARIINDRFEAVADFDAVLAVIGRQQQKNAAIVFFASDSQLLIKVHGVRVDAFSIQRADRHDSHLRPGFLLKFRAQSLQGSFLLRADHPRKVRHIAGGMNALDVFGERETRAKERGAQQDGASKKVSSTHL